MASEGALLLLFANAIATGSAVYEVTQTKGRETALLGKLCFLDDCEAVLIGPTSEKLSEGLLSALLCSPELTFRCIREPQPSKQ